MNDLSKGVRMKFRNLVWLLALAGLMGCSGSSGGGSGGSTTTSLIQTSKMSCAGSSCIGTTTISASALAPQSVVHGQAVSSALTVYDYFNQTLIPAFNTIISKIEEGVRNGGATSCNDISIGFNGTVTAGGTSYDAQTAASVVTSPAGLFSTSSMSKRIAAKVSGGSNYLSADFNCGAGTDISPLVARIVTADGTQQLNAWFEKGSSNHIRILMVAKYSGTVYSAWFKTDDGDSYEIALASAGAVYWGAGKKSTKVINYQDSAGISLTCLDSETGAGSSGCTTTLAAPPTIPTDLVTVAIPTWTSVNNSVTLVSPSYP